MEELAVILVNTQEHGLQVQKFEDIVFAEESFDNLKEIIGCDSGRATFLHLQYEDSDIVNVVKTKTLPVLSEKSNPYGYTLGKGENEKPSLFNRMRNYFKNRRLKKKLKK